MRTVRGELLAEIVEYLDWHAIRIGVGFHHQRRNRRDEHRLRDPPLRLPVPRDITRDLPAAVTWLILNSLWLKSAMIQRREFGTA